MNNNLKQIVLNTISKHKMKANVKNIIVACSGGADSMALLHLLHSQKKALCINVCALHLNHNLRGESAFFDAQIVKDFCQKHEIILHEKVLNWQMIDDKNASENNLRKLRYEFFNEVLKQNENSVIATAHNENDNAETVLLHIARGAGLKGACGIPYKREKIIRPLLNVNRAQIEEYIKKHNIKFANDETNASLKYARNRVRNEIIPQLKKINSDAQGAIVRFSQNMQIADDYINIQACELLKSAKISNVAGESGYNANILKGAHEAILNEVCHILISLHADANFAKMSLLKNAIINGFGSVELNKKITINASQNFIRTVYTDENKKCENENINTQNQNWQISFENIKNGDEITDLNGEKLYINITKYEETVNFKKISEKHLKNIADYGKITKAAIFRTIKANDMFCMANSNCTKMLKKIYSEKKFSINLRQTNPVLAIDNKIIWVNNLGFAKGFSPDENTKYTIQINNYSHE